MTGTQTQCDIFASWGLNIVCHLQASLLPDILKSVSMSQAWLKHSQSRWRHTEQPC